MNVDKNSLTYLLNSLIEEINKQKIKEHTCFYRIFFCATNLSKKTFYRNQPYVTVDVFKKIEDSIESFYKIRKSSRYNMGGYSNLLVLMSRQRRTEIYNEKSIIAINYLKASNNSQFIKEKLP